MQLVNAAAAQPMVSGQLAHMPAAAQVDAVANFASGGALTVNHFGSSPAGPSAFNSAVIASLPKGVRPQDPASTDAVPKSVSDFARCLWWWLQFTPELRATPAVFDAWQLYVRETVQYANDYGVPCSRAYHTCCMEALQHGGWNPLSHGPSFDRAYMLHIAPSAAAKGSGRAWGRSGAQSASGRSKRKTPPSGDQQDQQSKEQRSGSSSSFSASGSCRIHKSASHTDAQCYLQHGEDRDSTRPASVPGANSSSRQAAAPGRSGN